MTDGTAAGDVPECGSRAAAQLTRPPGSRGEFDGASGTHRRRARARARGVEAALACRHRRAVEPREVDAAESDGEC